MKKEPQPVPSMLWEKALRRLSIRARPSPVKAVLIANKATIFRVSVR